MARLSAATRHVGGGVADGREVGRPRPRLEVREEAVVAHARLHLGDAALGIVLVAEDDRFRGTRGLAGGLDLPVLDLPALVARVGARAVDALHAVRALLHDPAAAHRDVGVAHHLEGGRRPVLVQVEVEPAHLVGTVVRAVARADAAVVDHVVEPLVAVHGGGDGTDDLAGRVLALHAGDGLVEGLRALRLSLVVAVDPDPVHLAAAAHLVLPDHRDVVLRDAGGHAGVAADA